MKYGSVCSGIEAATAAWHELGWKPSFFSEIEGFPRAVLQHHYPKIPLHGDFTTIKGDEYDSIDLLVGGTPCQSFSVAGLRGGLDDDRGNLALEFLRLADRTRPRWLVWENVPGVLSSNGGRDFGSIIGGMVELGYGIAYRILDAQYFGVAQRRRRVFIVGYFGDWRPAAAVLFERHSLQGHPPPRREKGQRATGTIEASLGRSRGAGTPTSALSHWDGAEHPHPTLNQSNNAGGVGQSNQELFSQRGAYLTRDVSHALNAGSMFRLDHESETFVADTERLKVRRLTPRECERLQGFPDDYTAIPWRGKSASDCPDGPRYKALGNSMAVPVMRWIGQRIQMVEALPLKD